MCSFIYQCVDQRQNNLTLITEDPIACYNSSRLLSEHLYSSLENISHSLLVKLDEVASKSLQSFISFYDHAITE
jgi:hypothetical protein